MLTSKNKLYVAIGLFGIMIMCLNVSAQTAGTLTFSCATDAPSGTWGNNHVLAIWIEDIQNPSKFIKTKAKYGHEDDHLTSWVSKSGKNLVDAETGATLTSYTTRSIIWDGTDVSNNVIADGTYKIFIEMGWGRDKQDDHAVTSFEFNKGAEVVQETLAGNSNFSDVSIKWTPDVTFINEFENENSVIVFPNPTKGKLSFDFKQTMQSATITVENSTGVLIYKKNLENNYTGIYNIDLSNFANGLYIIKIKSAENLYVYKTLLAK